MKKKSGEFLHSMTKTLRIFAFDNEKVENIDHQFQIDISNPGWSVGEDMGDVGKCAGVGEEMRVEV